MCQHMIVNKSVSLSNHELGKKGHTMGGLNSKKNRSFVHTTKPKPSLPSKGKKKPTPHLIPKTKHSLNRTNTSGARSSHSHNTHKSSPRDYLMINQRIYSCDHLEQVNQQLILPSGAFSYSKYYRTVLRHVGKLHTYFSTFLQRQNYQQLTNIRLSKLSKTMKSKLYLLLKQDQHKEEVSLDVEGLTKEAIEKVQTTTAEIIKHNVQYSSEAVKWKNKKLHQLMTASQLLVNNFQQVDSLESELEVLLEHNPPTLIQYQEQYNIQSNNKYQHLGWQKYPPAKQEWNSTKARVLVQRGQILGDSNQLTIFSILYFLDGLYGFMHETGMVSTIVWNLHQCYGLSQKDKCVLHRSRIGQWPFLLEEKRKNMTPVLPKTLFNNYQKQIQYSSVQMSQECLRFFHQAIFDCLNELLVEYQPQYPYGVCHPADSFSPISFYIIDEDNFQCVWGELREKVAHINKHLLGLQVEESEKKEHEIESMKKVCSHENKGQWDRMKAQGYGHTLLNLSVLVLEYLFQEACHQFP